MKEAHGTRTTDNRARKKDPDSNNRVFLFVLVCALFPALGILVQMFCITNSAEAKVYIDITSPGVRRLPVSIKTSGSPASREIESIVKNDLEFTGLFSFVDPDVPGAEIRTDIEVDVSAGFKIIFSVYDVIENREELRRKLSASKETSIRSIAHRISNSVYEVATGKKGVFETKLSFLVNTSPGAKELQVMDWDGYNPLRLVAKGLTSSQSWSQDGRYLIYSSERDRSWKIYLLDLNSYREMILFSSLGLNLVGGTAPDGLISFSSSKDGSSEIYVINDSGKGFKKLTRSFGIDVSPVFSPDGSRIAFVSDRGGAPQIYTMDSEGKDVRRLTFEGSYNTSPSWSPDGRWISYTGRTNGKNQIFVVKFDGTDLRQLTFEGNNEAPTFSPDGFFIAFDSDRGGGRGIYIMRLNGEGQKRITKGNIKAMSPKWSPFLK